MQHGDPQGALTAHREAADGAGFGRVDRAIVPIDLFDEVVVNVDGDWTSAVGGVLVLVPAPGEGSSSCPAAAPGRAKVAVISRPVARAIPSRYIIGCTPRARADVTAAAVCMVRRDDRRGITN